MAAPAELTRGIEHFNQREFFEAHEVWETLWRATPGPERELYHGMIQLAVTGLHLTRGNVPGARYELDRARTHLTPFLPRAQGIDLTGLLQQIERCLAQGSAQDLPSITLNIETREG